MTIDTERFADALVTEEGEVRLYVGNTGDYFATGAIPFDRPDRAVQFVGRLEDGSAGAREGEGRLIGERCSEEAASPFCGKIVPATIRASVTPGGMNGDIRIDHGPDGVEIWPLDLGFWPDWYRFETRIPAGDFQELLAEFASSNDTLMTIDASGRLFFQSAGSGCIGNGTIAPHGDGRFTVFDVRLTVEECKGTRAYQNGNFKGLATLSPSNVWNYDDMLRLWVSQDDAPAALTTWGARQ